MNKNLDYRTIGLSRQSELVTPTGLNRFTSFTTLYGSELHSSGGVTKSSRPYNNLVLPSFLPPKSNVP